MPQNFEEWSAASIRVKHVSGRYVDALCLADISLITNCPITDCQPVATWQVKHRSFSLKSFFPRFLQSRKL